MARLSVRLNSSGIAAVLKSDDVRELVTGKAGAVAAAANANLGAAGHPEITAEVESYTTDRAAAQVVILHPAAMALQARYGILTRAAGEAGLELRPYAG